MLRFERSILFMRGMTGGDRPGRCADWGAPLFYGPPGVADEVGSFVGRFLRTMEDLVCRVPGYVYRLQGYREGAGEPPPLTFLCMDKWCLV